MAGYSDYAMRAIARQFGAPYALGEVVLDRLVTQAGKFQRRVLRVEPDDHPLGGQLMGTDPGEVAAAAALLAESGFDVIDINFACPVRKVLGRGRGGYLLSQPEAAIEILRRVRGAVPPRVPLTLKLRRGLDDSADSARAVFRIVDAAFELGLAAITVHARTVKQRYVGPSQWEFLTRVKRHVGDRIVLGSGDLFSAADVARMIAQTGVDGVSIARGGVGNPWIFREARAVLAGRPPPEPPSVAEQGATIRRHFELCLGLHGPRIAPRRMRKFGIKYAELHPLTAQVRDAFIRVRNAEEWWAVLDEWYDPRRVWPSVRRKNGPGALLAAGAE